MTKLKPLHELDESLQQLIKADAESEALAYKTQLEAHVKENGLDKSFPLNFETDEAKQIFINIMLSVSQHAFSMGFLKAMTKVGFEDENVCFDKASGFSH